VHQVKNDFFAPFAFFTLRVLCGKKKNLTAKDAKGEDAKERKDGHPKLTQHP